MKEFCKGFIVVNKFLNSEKFEDIYKRLLESAKNNDMSLSLVTNDELILDESIEKFAKEYDFCLFWDKDIDLAKRLEIAGIRTFNKSSAIENCDDKWKIYEILAGMSIPTPYTICLPFSYDNVGYNSYDFLDSVEKKLGYPFVIKERKGSFGTGVFLAHSRQEAEGILKKIGSKPSIAQEYIKEANGKDIRINMVGNLDVATMQRINDNDFRANITNGGKMEKYNVGIKERELAKLTMMMMGLDFAGVDVLISDRGPLICEVNSNAHFKNIYDCTGVNVADHIMSYIKDKLGTDGIIVYEPEVAVAQEWYITKYIEAFKKRGIIINLVSADEIRENIDEAVKGASFAIVRTIDPPLSTRLERHGIRVFNSAKISALCNDKGSIGFNMLCIKAGIPTMPLYSEPHYPMIVKSRAGHGGKEVYYVKNEDDYEMLKLSIGEDELKIGYIMQKVCDTPGVDIRVYVIGQKIVASMKRENVNCCDMSVPVEQRFKSNYSLGGKASIYEVDKEIENYVKSMASVLRPDFVGIDFIIHDGHAILNEVEDVVGSRMLYDYTDIDIVDEYAEYIANEIRK